MVMKLVNDPDSYVEQQEIFTGEMIARIARHIEEAGITGEALKSLTGNIVFEVCSMLDGVSEVSFEGGKSAPFLTFQKGDEELIDFGGNSYAHELVDGILDAMFDENT